MSMPLMAKAPDGGINPSAKIRAKVKARTKKEVRARVKAKEARHSSNRV